MAEFDPFSPEALADPYPQYERLRAEAPVFYSERVRSWVLFRYADVRSFFTEPAFSSDRSKAKKYAGNQPQMRSIGTDPPDHDPVRATITQSLYPMVRDLLPAIEELVADMTDQLTESIDRFIDTANIGRTKTIDLIDDFAYPLPITIIADLFGVPEADRGQFQSWSHDIARGMDRFYGPKRANEFDAFRSYFYEMLAERRKSPGDDLLSRMLALDLGEEALTDDELVALSTTLIFAGHETTTNLIGNGMLALLQDPDQYQRLRAAPDDLAETAVEEFLRFDAPAQMVSRTVIEPVNFAGADMAEGDAVLAVIGSANRDEAEFGSDAGRLDVGRSPNYHLTFGMGRHFCPGARLSRLEAKVAVPALMKRFDELGVVDGSWTHRDTAVLRGLEKLPVTV